MNQFPNKTVMLISILVVALLAGYRYSTKLNKQFLQFKFDWEKEKVLEKHPGLQIDTISDNWLELSGVKDEFVPDNQLTYAVEDGDSKRYFRFASGSKQNSKVTFTGLQWLNGQMNPNGDKVLLTVSELPMVQGHGKKVMTLGNFIFYANEAKYFRRKIALESNIDFIGNRKDVFNFPYSELSNLDDTLISEAQICIVFWAPFAEEDMASIQFQQQLDRLGQSENIEKIIWIKLPTIQGGELGDRYAKVNEIIDNLTSEKLVVLDTDELFKRKNQEYFMEDGWLSKVAYETLVVECLKLLEHG